MPIKSKLLAAADNTSASINFKGGICATFEYCGVRHEEVALVIVKAFCDY